jgi:hypothetical protein
MKYAFGMSLSAAGYLCSLVMVAFGPVAHHAAALLAGVGFTLAFGAFAGMAVLTALRTAAPQATMSRRVAARR